MRLPVLLVSLVFSSLTFGGACCPSGSNCAAIGLRPCNPGEVTSKETAAGSEDLVQLRKPGRMLNYDQYKQLTEGNRALYKRVDQDAALLALWITSSGDVVAQLEPVSESQSLPYLRYVRQIPAAKAAEINSLIRGIFTERPYSQPCKDGGGGGTHANWETAITDGPAGMTLALAGKNYCRKPFLHPSARAEQLRTIATQIFDEVKGELGRSELSAKPPESFR